MRIASIDIGTNAVLLLIADVDRNGEITAIEHQQRYPRIGKKVDEKYIILPTAFEKIKNILEEYKIIANKFGVERIITASTSAVRDSTNKHEFLSYIKTSTGINVELLSGEEEAKLTYDGTINGIKGISKKTVVLDIGGGSTEISFFEQNKFVSYSLQIGAVRLTERYFKNNPPHDEEILKAKQAIANEFKNVKQQNLSSYSLIGVAGTMTTLACLEQNLKDFDIQKVSGYRLNKEKINNWLNKLLKMTSEQILQLSNTTKGREDILPAGVLILNEFMMCFHFKEIIVSERGLRYGLILREWEKYIKK